MSSAIVLIHGRGPKPKKETLLACWKDFLPSEARNLPADMVFWVELFHYNPPVMPDADNDCSHIAAADLPDISAKAFSTALSPDDIARMQQQVVGAALGWDDIARLKDQALEAFWRGFTAITDNQFAVDAQNFFADDPNLRTASRQMLKDAIQQARGTGPKPNDVLVIAHSFGTIVAYEAARELRNQEIHTLITMGSPLAWCYDVWGPAKPPPAPGLYFKGKEFPRFGLRNWWNVYDPADPVATAVAAAVAPQIAPAYRSGDSPVIVDTPISNTYSRSGDLASPHDYRGYLESEPVKRAVELFCLETGS